MLPMYTQFKKVNVGEKWITAGQRIRTRSTFRDNFKTCKHMEEFLDGAMHEQVCIAPTALYCHVPVASIVVFLC